MGGHLATSQTGNTTSSTGEPRRVISGIATSKALLLQVTVGATPTVHLDIQGSVDNVNWFNTPYALPATPSTFVSTQITITAAATYVYLLAEPAQPTPYAFLRYVLSANTNVTVANADFFL